jgi:hypothetical protein
MTYKLLEYIVEFTPDSQPVFTLSDKIKDF